MQETAPTFPPEQEVALAWATGEDREVMASLLAFDNALARAVAVASEPIVGQLRLAWWRDALRHDAAVRPRGNPLLDDLVRHFGERLPGLVPLIDGWEAILLADSLGDDAISALVEGRAGAWDACALVLELAPTATSAARVWALADFAASLGEGKDRTAALDFAARQPHRASALPSRMRPLAVLAVLGSRALARGGQPLLAGRNSALVALRAGLIGR